MQDRPPKSLADNSLTPTERLIVYVAAGILFAFGVLIFSVEFYRQLAANRGSGGQGTNVSPFDSPDALIADPDHPRKLVDFKFVDQDGHSLSRQDLDHKIVVVNFIFTSCSFICPHINAQMTKIQRLTADDPEVKLISLTLDPEDDTVPVLAAYGQKFGEDPKRWSFVTGDETALHDFIGTSFLAKDTTGDFAGMPGNFANSQRIALVDQQGQVVKYYDGLDERATNEIVKEIAELHRSHE
jgi:protein SCO1/2